MFDFIYTGSAELRDTVNKPNIQNKNICHRMESNHRPLAFQPAPKTAWGHVLFCV